jgi:hypothetical protein
MADMEEIKSVELVQWKGGGDVYVIVNNVIVHTTGGEEGQALMKEVVELCMAFVKQEKEKWATF